MKFEEQNKNLFCSDGLVDNGKNEKRAKNPEK